MSKTFVLSDSSQNSYGFRIDMSKLKLDRFRDNPVMLYNHKELVGKWDELRIAGDKLLGSPVFMEDEGEELSQKVKRRVDASFVKGASVGIHILNVVQDTDGVPLVEAEVFECSLCDIPSNQNAIVLYDQKGVRLEGKAFQLALDDIVKQKPTIHIQTMNLFADTRAELNLEENASELDVNNAVKTMAKELTAAKKELETIRENNADALVKKALSAGKITADKQASYKKLAIEDYSMASDILGSLPGKKILAGSEVADGGKANLDDRSNWTFKDWRQKDTAGLLAIKAEDPTRYAEIIKS